MFWLITPEGNCYFCCGAEIVKLDDKVTSVLRIYIANGTSLVIEEGCRRVLGYHLKQIEAHIHAGKDHPLVLLTDNKAQA